ncbi:metal ABC transporter solute-binding protein, Zn/Mn family [Plastorhodobacter daqingensis]|uniref:Metal ABC transporter solute-binding protein, Zn/Mn family n=1 Tax=Plastorhodobacter daqingensis TaxID=1387281 RepID=A0ABW2UFP7_9RHOB
MNRAFATTAAFVLAGGAAWAEPPRVLATVGMIADVAAEVAGPCVAVEALMGPGIDPHLYQPTAGDVGRMQRAEAIFYVGLGLEGQLGTVLGRLADSRSTLSVGEAIAETADLLETDGGYGVDPHLWMDVQLWTSAIPAIRTQLAQLAPGCDGLDERADAYAAQLAALHGWVGESIASIPEEARALVTAHDAFGYYARAYGITEIALQGLTTEAEASIADIRETADEVARRGVPAVFVESTINPRSIEALRGALRDRGHNVALGGELYSDAMGEAGTAEGTYIGMIRANTLAITTALGGTPAAWPDALAGWSAQWGLGNP